MKFMLRPEPRFKLRGESVQNYSMYHFSPAFLTFGAAIAAAAWLYLLLSRGGFWRAQPCLDSQTPPALAHHPAVVAVVPARNEAQGIETCLRSLFAQDHCGPFRVILVDDGSEDGTSDIARDTARAVNAADRLDIIRSQPLPPGWTGKLWAVAQGVRRAESLAPDYLWLTDADIAHDVSELRRLAAIAESENRDLVSLMVLLRCESFWERLLIPAFVFFFQMLFPFPQVNDPGKRIAAAAGGSMLVRRTALEAAGSIAAIRDAVIDDCALANRIKERGAIWLGLTKRTRSLRPYRSLREIWHMVARSAYAQLKYSPLLLAVSVTGLAIVFAVPVVAFVAGFATDNAPAATLGTAALCMMWAGYRPMLRFYGQDHRRGALLLPVAALLYCAMTVDSAWRHYRGNGGGWKGRSYGPARGAAPGAVE